MGEYVRYGFTLRKVKLDKKIDEAYYQAHLLKLKTFCDIKILGYVFENESGLHCHGVMDIHQDQPLYKIRRRGWHLFLEQIWDEKGWTTYMNKHQE